MEGRRSPYSPIMSMSDSEISSLGIQFRPNSRIESTAVDDDVPVVDTTDEELINRITKLKDDRAQIVTNPNGYNMLFPVESLTVETIRDRYQTALAYLDLIINEEPRRLRPSIFLNVEDSAAIRDVFDDVEAIIREFADKEFNEEGSAEISQTGTQAKLKYTHTVIEL